MAAALRCAIAGQRPHLDLGDADRPRRVTADQARRTALFMAL
jgi:hypothetical protein